MDDQHDIEHTGGKGQPHSPKPVGRWRQRMGWLLLGLLGGIAGAVIAGVLTARSLEGNTDDFAGLIVVVTVPLGYLVGTLFVVILGWATGRSTRSGGTVSGGTGSRSQGSRPTFAFLGALLPFVGIAVAVMISNFAGSVRDSLNDHTDATTTRSTWVQEQAEVPGRWSSKSSQRATHSGCEDRVSSTESQIDINPNLLAQTLYDIEDVLTGDGFETLRASNPNQQTQLWHLAAHRPDQLIEITATREGQLGTITMVVFAGGCIDEQGAQLMGVGFSDTGWDVALLEQTDPTIEPLQEALRLTDPNGWWPAFEATEPANGVGNCADDTLDVTPHISVNPLDAADVIFAWYVDRLEVLEAEGWYVETSRHLSPDEHNGHDVERWMILARQGDYVISLTANFSYWDAQGGATAAAVRRVYVGECVAANGDDLDHLAGSVSGLELPLDLSGPPDLTD